MNRSAVFLLVANIFVVIGCATQSGAGPARDNVDVRVSNLATPGAFDLRNDGSSEVSLARRVAIERLSGGRWEPTEVVIELTERCADESAGQCVKLAVGAVLRPVAWNGYSCAPQCPGPCRANVYLGPGTFHIVASTCDRKHRFAGPPFALAIQTK